MKKLKIIEQPVLGAIMGIGIQWLSLGLLGLYAGTFTTHPFDVSKVDPVISRSFFYNSIGLFITAVILIFFLFKRKWPLLVGVVLGSLLWIPVLTELVALGGL